MPNNPAIAIILVNWNGWRDVIECVDSLLQQRYRNFHVFVVDNDSSDQSIENIADWCAHPKADPGWRKLDGVKRYSDEISVPIRYRIVDRSKEALPYASEERTLTLIRSGANRGFAGGCNVGISAASPDSFDFFWLLNTDTVVHEDSLERLVSRALQDPNIGMVGSTLRYYDSPNIVQALGGAYLEPTRASSRHLGQGSRVDAIPKDTSELERSMTYVVGASMLVSSKFVREVGLMQEDYFLYYEEIDWALRGLGKFKIGYAADSHIFHKSGASSSKVMPLFTANYYYRNRIRFMSRFFPEYLGATKRSLLLEFLRLTVKGQWARARLIASILRQANALASEARRPLPAATTRPV